MYLRPLLGSGMPDAFRLRHHPLRRCCGVGGDESSPELPANARITAFFDRIQHQICGLPNQYVRKQLFF
jgi:hypothetical protein